jgi:phage terminase large subunit-like protein
VKAADTDVVTGGLATYTLIDETHEFTLKKNAPKVFIEVKGALASRPDGFLIQITTQSKDPPAGIFASELEAARAVRDGRIKIPGLLPILYEFPEEFQKDKRNLWKNKKYWHIVNPNLGLSVDEDFLTAELIAAEHAGAAAMALFASQHFNIQIGSSLHAGRWPGVDLWDGCADPTLTLESLIERSEVIVATIDGGGLVDWFGLCIMGREKLTGRYLCWSHAWAHESVLARYPELEQTMRDFEDDGDLTITNYRFDNTSIGDDGAEKVDSTIAVDLRELIGYIMQAEASGKLGPLGFDPYGVKVVVSALVAEGIDRDTRVMPISQGYRLQGAIKTTELYLAVGSLSHSGSRMMSWCVSNCRTDPKGNAVLVTKEASGAGKIDPAMAMFSAVEVMATNPEPMGSVYEDHGIRFA